MRYGAFDLLILLVVGLVWVVPVVAAIWALITLHRIRTTQKEMLGQLAAIERSIQSGRPT